ncbi:hypothetical protein GNI_155690 [Gregarina niphandrodes]|uniref:Uncharacterized protein n=1 Tax=Gregarina niphandrodes TaxID=110365 RepID=A0A023AZ78_GRENI|nr:hypothetical protein GNI_155690 [Gregarina niphandrodes]EZG43927.1 hypothetical protein GNI_155690 [Gregarina niphandrodes]|eukprot:XP_011132898.1 hypothetical protein GNI_155690 [Gregarina niphandrodes]
MNWWSVETSWGSISQAYRLLLESRTEYETYARDLIDDLRLKVEATQKLVGEVPRAESNALPSEVAECMTASLIEYDESSSDGESGNPRRLAGLLSFDNYGIGLKRRKKRVLQNTMPVGQIPIPKGKEEELGRLGQRECTMENMRLVFDPRCVTHAYYGKRSLSWYIFCRCANKRRGQRGEEVQALVQPEKTFSTTAVDFCFMIFLLLATFPGFGLGDWLVQDASELNPNVTAKAVSCAMAVSLDTMNPCPTECTRFCGMTLNSGAAWSVNVTQGECAMRNSMCSAPVGLKATIDAPEKQSIERRYVGLTSTGGTTEYLPFGPLSQKDLTREGNAEVVTYHRALILGPEELKNIGDPYRLSYASVLQDSRLQPLVEGQYCGYVRVGRSTTNAWRATYDPNLSTENMTQIHYDGPLLEMRNLYRLPRSAASTNLSAPQAFAPGPFRHTPTIHQLIQQWYLRHGDDPAAPKLAVTISREYPAYQKLANPANRAKEAGIGVNTPRFVEAQADMRMRLETFTTLSWGGFKVSSICAERSNCGACVTTGFCSWCDMGGANLGDLNMWGDWFATSKSRQKDGSACGVPPHLCAMMGGEPSTASCPVSWKDEWDTFMKSDDY